MPIIDTRAAVLAAVAALALLTGCGEDAGDASGGDATEELAEVQRGSGVPEECAGPFPYAWGEPELETADLLPGDWPEPPPAAVLCDADAGGGETQTVDYAVDASGADVLDHYEAALKDLGGYDVTRELRPELGHEVLNGSGGGAGFEIDPRDGGFRIALVAG